VAWTFNVSAVGSVGGQNYIEKRISMADVRHQLRTQHAAVELAAEAIAEALMTQHGRAGLLRQQVCSCDAGDLRCGCAAYMHTVCHSGLKVYHFVLSLRCALRQAHASGARQVVIPFRHNALLQNVAASALHASLRPQIYVSVLSRLLVSARTEGG
jgi:hypothetical protein